MRASVAYWTLKDHHGLGAAASHLLKNSESFLCVDIHLPTNLDVMKSMSVDAANVFLHLERIPKQTIPDLRYLTERGMPEHLLHQKILLFDIPGNGAELWVGSHNWTTRALEGPNIEASLVLDLDRDSDLYKDALANLNYARDEVCERMDPDRIEEYKAWQQGETLGEVGPAIIVAGWDVDNLEGSVINIFGRESEEYQAVRGMNRVGNTLRFAATDSITEYEYVYSARILATGVLAGSGGTGAALSFLQPGRWADKGARGRNAATLEPNSIPPQRMVDSSSFWVTVEIQGRRRESVMEIPTKEPLWIRTTASPLLDRMDDISEVESAVIPIKSRIPIQVPNKTRSKPLLSKPTMYDKLYGENIPLVAKRLFVPEE
jgi:hypothetical protein